MGGAIFYIQSGIETKPWNEVAGLMLGWISGLSLSTAKAIFIEVGPAAVRIKAPAKGIGVLLIIRLL